MKSCIEWRKHFKYLPQVDEFNIDFKENKTKKLLSFLDTYAITQRVNIRDVTESDDINLIASLKEKYNVAICFTCSPEEIKTEDYKTIEKAKVPFYFDYPIDNWGRLEYYLSLGVSDVFISGELGFDLPRVREKVKEKEDVQIRVWANIAQGSNPKSDGLKDFYIRPEDIDIYGEYIDIIEFFNSEKEQNILYDVYFHDKAWDGKLKEIIKGMSCEVNNYYILGDDFVKRRIECKQDCIKGGKCRLCDRLQGLADALEKSKDFEVFRKRKEDN